MSSFVLQLPPKNIATNNNDFGVAFSFPHLGVLFLYEYISVESFPGMHQRQQQEKDQQQLETKNYYHRHYRQCPGVVVLQRDNTF